MIDLEQKIEAILQNEKLNPLWLSFVGILHKYEQEKGLSYLQKWDRTEFEGITDTQGNYIYCRYMSDIKALQLTYKVSLRMVICLPNCQTDIKDIAGYIMYLIGAIPSNFTLQKEFSIETNRQKVYLSETNKPVKSQKSDIQLAYVDFMLDIPKPNWDCFEIDCKC